METEYVCRQSAEVIVFACSADQSADIPASLDHANVSTLTPDLAGVYVVCHTTFRNVRILHARTRHQHADSVVVELTPHGTRELLLS